jgi:hypothetical protein
LSKAGAVIGDVAAQHFYLRVRHFGYNAVSERGVAGPPEPYSVVPPYEVAVENRHVYTCGHCHLYPLLS